MSNSLEEPQVKAEDVSDGSVTEDEDSAPASSSNKLKHELSLTGDLSCDICLALLSHPYTIIPCLHTFDKACLAEWWKTRPSCPVCKEISTSARYSFQLSGIIEYHRYHKKRKFGAGSKDSQSQTEETDVPQTREEIFPQASSNDYEYYSDRDENDDEARSDSEVDYDGTLGSANNRRPLLPSTQPNNHGALFPCISCTPGNATGYTCPTPIVPAPSTVPPDAFAMRYLSHTSLVDRATRQFRSEAAGQHRHCDACTAYVPARGLHVQCQLCKIYTCNAINPDGCPRIRTSMLQQDRLIQLSVCEGRIIPNINTASTNFNYSNLWYATCERPLAGNTVEKTRFENFMLSNARGRSVDTVVDEYKASLMRYMLEQGRAPRRRARVDGTRLETINEIADRIAQDERDRNGSTSASASNPRGPRFRVEAVRVTHLTANADADVDAVADASVSAAGNEPPQTEDPNWCVCEDCFADVSKSHFFRWWSSERAMGTLDPAEAALPHCWYGRECRTQTHNQSHAERYSHMCENTGTIRGRVSINVIDPSF